MLPLSDRFPTRPRYESLGCLTYPNTVVDYALGAPGTNTPEYLGSRCRGGPDERARVLLTDGCEVTTTTTKEPPVRAEGVVGHRESLCE